MAKLLAHLFTAFHTTFEPDKRYVTGRGAVLIGVYLLAIAGSQTYLLRYALGEAAGELARHQANRSAAASAVARAAPGGESEGDAMPPRRPAVERAGGQNEPLQSQGESPADAPADQGDTTPKPDGEAEEGVPVSLPLSLVLAASAGALGGTLHATRSLYWYAGNRTLVVSWIPMYLLKPFASALLATLVCLVLGAGLWTDGPKHDDVIQIVAVAALVGLFSDEASEKLKQIASAIFTPKETGKDHQAGVAPEPAVASISPQSPANGPAEQTLTLSLKGCKTPAVAWLTDPNGQLKVYPTSVPPNTTDTVECKALLDMAGRWTVRVTDRDGHTSEPVSFQVT